ncbi:hypothetical protein ACYZX9_11655 [Sphingomonas citri]|jgi:hypothetical protein|uniref:Uncharacterized protein n=1 Tax=Sphingomonas citri TaxID=2862499 RepID=A0ABS7BNI4_9SPHN|nr:hypothetical protein [Sphingomonas citri]MBW6531182.1 hypothetical protein [Sphingomonas citri]
MQFFARLSPLRAARDLRFFFQTRERYEWGFLALSVAITGFFVWAFFHDSYFEKEYKPNIIYFEQWKLDRTDAQIIAQQQIDQAKREIAEREQRAREEKLRQGFKRLDDKLNAMGI